MKKSGFFFAVLLALFAKVALADGIPVCDLKKDPWQVWRGVSEIEEEYSLMAGNVWDPLRKVEILTGRGVAVCNFIPEEGMSIVIPNGFNPKEKNFGISPEKRVWIRSKTGGSYPVMSDFIPDITKVIHRDHPINLQVEEENNITIQAGNERLSVSPHSLSAPPDTSKATPPWEPVIQPPNGETGFRGNVRKVVDDSDAECGNFCQNTLKVIVVGGIAYLIHSIIKDSKARPSVTQQPVGAGGPANPGGFLQIRGQM